MHVLCILIGLIEGSAETPYCIAAVGISDADADRWYM